MQKIVFLRKNLWELLDARVLHIFEISAKFHFFGRAFYGGMFFRLNKKEAVRHLDFLTLIRMTKDEKVLAIFKGLML